VHYGINDEFIRWLGATMEPGSSALIVLVHRCTPDKVYPSCVRSGEGVSHLALT